MQKGGIEAMCQNLPKFALPLPKIPSELHEKGPQFRQN